jgi:signal transduction histidine kinase
MPTIELREQRVLILAPRGRDAEVIAGVVARDGLNAQIVQDVDELMEAMELGAASAMLAEEALTPEARQRIVEWMGKQEPWSDFPFVLLLAKRAGSAPAQLQETLARLGNVILLERPLSSDTLAAAAASASRARRRQYEARTIMVQRETVSQELAFLNEHLEARVHERSIELARANDRLAAEMMERERAQQAMVQAQKLEFLGRFTGGVAHDFNNLLNVIQGNMDLIGMFSKEDITKARAKTAQAACKRGAKLTSQLLTFARNQSLDLQPLSVKTMFEVVSELAPPILGSGVELDFAIDSGVESVLADASQMEMALLNLAVNARDAMDGKGRLSFHASLATPPAGLPSDQAFVRVAVSDNGSGMSPEVVAKVFEPFFTTKDVGKGTGLGLSQVYGMAQQSGGAASARSVQGAGATIEIWMRSVAGSDADQASPEAAAVPLGGFKILVVEDDDAVRAGIVDALMALGCDVSQASSGPAGLDALAMAKPQLLFTDYLMPGMTGVELVVKAREMFPGLAVLVATGYGDMSAIEDAVGTDLVLRKPFQLAELSAAVSRAANRRASPR